jgi:hypothetical protein
MKGSPLRQISLADWVPRLILDDRSRKVDMLLTFNPKDFHDVCQHRGIPLEPSLA